jgi:hypothetical protein
VTKGLSRSIPRSIGDDDQILQRVAAAPDLLIVCDFEGTLTEADERGQRPVEGAMRLMSNLAALPQTAVAIISDGSVARSRPAALRGLDPRVTIIERCEEADPGTRAHAHTPAPRKDLAIDGLLTQSSPSLIFFAGDDASDEIVFTALGIDDIGCKVGSGTTNATLRMGNPKALVTFLASVLRRRRSLVQPQPRTSARHTTSAPAPLSSGNGKRKAIA